MIYRVLCGVAAVAIALTLFSCKKTPPVPPAKGLKLSEQVKTVGFDEARTSLRITANIAWSLDVTEGSDWITPDLRNGEAGSAVTVNFTLIENPGETVRTGKVTITAEGEDDPYIFTITQNSRNTLTGVNKWIYDELCGWYYWNSAVKAADVPLNSLEYDAFLEKLVLNAYAKGAKDSSENPATIDGGFYTDGGRYTYSYIDRMPAGTRATESNQVSFGFDVRPFYIDNNDRLGLLVLWVRPDSPAAKEGLKRGMWITKYNGSDIYAPFGYENFRLRLHYQQGGNTMTFADEKGKTYNLTAVEMKVSPILKSEVITTGGGKKVAYLFYNGFETGDNGEFDKELRNVFGEFKKNQATELVLDLRYNPGGYVESCRILTSLSADVNTSDIFLKQRFNNNINDVYPRVTNPQVEYFQKEPNSMALRKIYVLETDYSASASEMVINSIRGVLGDESVVHIGSQTNGKNVGMTLRQTTIDGYSYEMWPITFKVLNAKDFCDYASGFTPNYYIDEFWDITNAAGSGAILELGNPNERLLKTALTLIDGKSVTADTRASSTRAVDGTRQPATTLMKIDPRRGGAKYIPDMQQ